MSATGRVIMPMMIMMMMMNMAMIALLFLLLPLLILILFLIVLIDRSHHVVVAAVCQRGTQLHKALGDLSDGEMRGMLEN